MPADEFALRGPLLQFPVPALEGFLVVLARVGGAMAFVPMPGLRNAPLAPRVLLTLALTLALLPTWPGLNSSAKAASLSLSSLLVEVAFGLTAGILVAWLSEAFILSMQIIGLQAGYAYASMIDPTTQADSSTLQVIAQLSAALLFFAAGLDRELFRVFAASIQTYPPGSFRLEPAMASGIIRFTASMLSFAFRLALPLVALLILVDVALALLGRINASLQLLTIAFPAKMLISMAVLAMLAALAPVMFQLASSEAVGLLWALAGKRL